MGQPRRRRRRRGRGSSTADQASAGAEQGRAASAQASPPAQPPTSRRRRRRRGGGRRLEAQPASPTSSADIFRRDRTPPETVGAPPDGRTLESVIGDLQSEWGVPQNPQEYRITLKVAEERQVRGERVAAIEEVKEDLPPPRADGRPRREKAPAAPRIETSSTATRGGEEPATPRRRRGRRRGRRGGRSSS